MVGKFLPRGISSELQKSLFIMFLGDFYCSKRRNEGYSTYFDDQRHLIIFSFLPVSYSFHIKMYYSMCLWSSTITQLCFWLDKVSKYHIDSLAKMIVQFHTPPTALQAVVVSLLEKCMFSVSAVPAWPVVAVVLSCGLVFTEWPSSAISHCGLVPQFHTAAQFHSTALYLASVSLWPSFSFTTS